MKLYPKGTSEDNKNYISLYLKNHDVENSNSIHIYAKYIMSIHNCNDYSCSFISKGIYLINHNILNIYA